MIYLSWVLASHAYGIIEENFLEIKLSHSLSPCSPNIKYLGIIELLQLVKVYMWFFFCRYDERTCWHFGLIYKPRTWNMWNTCFCLTWHFQGFWIACSKNRSWQQQEVDILIRFSFFLLNFAEYLRLFFLVCEFCRISWVFFSCVLCKLILLSRWFVEKHRIHV